MAPGWVRSHMPQGTVTHTHKSKIILFFIKDVRRCSEVIIARIWRPEVTTSLMWIPPSSLVSPGKRGHCRPTDGRRGVLSLLKWK